MSDRAYRPMIAAVRGFAVRPAIVTLAACRTMRRPSASSKTPRGRRVAYAKNGDGPTLMCAAWWVSHLEEDWADPRFRKFFEALGEHFTVYRYDRPGSGLSDRERDDITVEDEAETLEGLVEHLGLSKTHLFGLSCAGPPSLLFASQNPERVERVVLFGSFVRGSDVAPEPMQNVITDFVRANWGMGARMIADLFDPSMDGDERAVMCAVQQKSASKDMAADLLTLTFRADVASEAQRVDCPVLVLHRKEDPAIAFSAGRELAATLPNAIFTPLEGAAHVPWFGESEQVIDAVLSFLGCAPGPSIKPGPAYALEQMADVWKLTFESNSVFLKTSSRGLSDLAMLLRSPKHRNTRAHVDVGRGRGDLR